MRKFSLFLTAVLVALAFAGCSSAQEISETSSTSGDISNVSIQTSSPVVDINDETNFFNLDFAALQVFLSENIDAQDNKISMPFMYEVPAIDISFTPDGEMQDFRMSLRALSGENASEFIISQYKVEKTADSDFDVQLYEKDQHFLKESFSSTFVFEKFPTFMQWADSLDFEKMIQEYTVGNPVQYRFLAGVEIQRELIDSENVDCIFLDCSSGTPLQVEYSELSYSNADIFYFEPTHDVDVSNEYLDYYVILPFYSSSEDGGYQMENCDYSANNIIILFPNGI